MHPDMADNRKCVLVVEDDQPNILVIEIYLKEMGYNPVSVRNGPKALEKFKESRFDIVLLDLKLPDMNGFEIAAGMREIEKNANRPSAYIVAISGNANDNIRDFCLEKGMDDYLAKPYRLEDLKKKLAKFLSVQDAPSRFP